MDSLLYHSNYTFEENFKRGPVELLKLQKPTFKNVKPKFNLSQAPCGIPILHLKL